MATSTQGTHTQTSGCSDDVSPSGSAVAASRANARALGVENEIVLEVAPVAKVRLLSHTQTTSLHFCLCMYLWIVFHALLHFTVLMESLSQYRPPIQPTVIVCNPPYGERLGASDAALRTLYEEFGAFMRKKANSRVEHAFVVTPQPEFLRHSDLRAEEVATYNNGGLPVALMRVSPR